MDTNYLVGVNKPLNVQVSCTVCEKIALIELNNPPVNALSHSVRQALESIFDDCVKDESVAVIVIIGAGKMFVAGADINEFGLPPKSPHLPNLLMTIEQSIKPVVVALHGPVLGGGLELAMSAHYRVAMPGAVFGLPEVNLGLLPGAGGTQRLPRLLSIEDTLSIVALGNQIDAQSALDKGLIDKIAPEQDVKTAGLVYAKYLVENQAKIRRTSELACHQISEPALATLQNKIKAKAKGQLSPLACFKAVENALKLPFSQGIIEERALFQSMMDSTQRAALIHAFFAERKVSQLVEIKGVTPSEINSVGIIGGGTMGAGIAASVLLAKTQVTLVEQSEAAANKAYLSVMSSLQSAVSRGKLSEADYALISEESFKVTTEYSQLSEVDLVVEAVFESMEVKQKVFSQLDALCKPQTILATNTSYLDVNEIAAMTNRPEQVIGLHFFSPAHIMKLLEVVVADKTDTKTVASAFKFAKKLSKIGVRSGVCDGFIGNRILSRYIKAMNSLVLNGASPFQIDDALQAFGLAMGPFAVSDLAGLDIGWANRKRIAPHRDSQEIYAEFADRICEQGNFGRKTGKGFYVYENNNKARGPNDQVEEIIAAERQRKGIVAKAFDAQEIQLRYISAVVNEAAWILGEGIARRPLDIDVTLLNGYGFPRWLGGPLHYADSIGLDVFVTNIQRYTKEDPFLWKVAPLLQQLVDSNENFSSLNK